LDQQLQILLADEQRHGVITGRIVLSSCKSLY